MQKHYMTSSMKMLNLGHPTDTNKMAYCLTFINARHFEYRLCSHFRTWLNDNHGITYVHEVTTDVPYDVADKDNVTQRYNQNKAYFIQKLEEKQF